MTGRHSKWLPLLFVGPALFILVVFLVYPTLQTIYFSFTKGTMLNPGREFLGLANFERLLTADNTFLRLNRWPPSGVLPTTALWVLLFPPITVGIGLLIAILSDRVRYESTIKSIIFLPMVISSTAASVIFIFVYSPDLTKGVNKCHHDKHLSQYGADSLVRTQGHSEHRRHLCCDLDLRRATDRRDVGGLQRLAARDFRSGQRLTGATPGRSSGA